MRIGSSLVLSNSGYKLMKWVPGFVARRSKAHEFDLTGVVVDANRTEFKEGDEIIGVNPVCESRSLSTLFCSHQSS